MNIRLQRSVPVLLALALAGGAGSALRAQIPGMPLFTNPRYATGLRVHADIGQPTDQGTQPGDLTVVQGGVTFALGPVGIGASVGALRNDVKSLSTCNTSTGTNCNTNSKLTASALAQLRVAGGGESSWSLSLFGGASTDLTAYDALDCSSFTGAALTYCQAKRDSMTVKQLTIPVGAAIGLHIPLGIASLNLWGAPRVNITKFVNCPSSNTSLCSTSSSQFRWAAGADLPIFRVLSVRAAFDSGKVGSQTVSFWGVGASIGIGGMR